MNILIPMAGEGSRFKEAGYTFPKPLIEVKGEPMIKLVVDNFKDLHPKKFIFLVRKEHIEKYKYIPDYLNIITDYTAEIVEVDGLTEGAACTALLAKDHIGVDELLIVNSDQYIEYNKVNFNILRKHSDADGIVFTFNSTHPKWSFVKILEDNSISHVAEKRPISNIATCGAYYFSYGTYFINAAEDMIKSNSRVNNEFYIAPSINFLLQKNYKILPFFVEKMWGLGTPDDLNVFLNQFK